MSKKSLERTVIEGGRARYNKYERWSSNSEARVNSRAYMKKLITDPEEFEFTPEPRRKVVGQGFTDKLSPAYKWLRKHIGQKWDDVFSKLINSLDTRTISGRHIVYDHMLRDVAKHEYDYSGRSSAFVVNDEGILCECLDGRFYRWRNPEPKINLGASPSKHHMDRWLKDRQVRQVGTKVFWMIPQKHRWVECKEWRCWRTHREVVSYKDVPVQRGYMYHRTRNAVPEEAMMGPVATMRVEMLTKECYQGTGGFRQWRELSVKDSAFFFSLTEEWKETIGYLTRSEWDAKIRRQKEKEQAILDKYKKRRR